MCQAHTPKARRGWRPCNVWVFCSDPSGQCWSADIWPHETGECWLKYQHGWDGNRSTLAVNDRGRFSDRFREQHTTAPQYVPWVAGALPGYSSHGNEKAASR